MPSLAGFALSFHKKDGSNLELADWRQWRLFCYWQAMLMLNPYFIRDEPQKLHLEQTSWIGELISNLAHPLPILNVKSEQSTFIVTGSPLYVVYTVFK
jgi:hypothetical protein